MIRENYDVTLWQMINQAGAFTPILEWWKLTTYKHFTIKLKFMLFWQATAFTKGCGYRKEYLGWVPAQFDSQRVSMIFNLPFAHVVSLTTPTLCEVWKSAANYAIKPTLQLVGYVRSHPSQVTMTTPSTTHPKTHTACHYQAQQGSISVCLHMRIKTVPVRGTYKHTVVCSI